MVFALNASGIATCRIRRLAGELTGDDEFVEATIACRRAVIDKAPLRQSYKRSRDETVRGGMEEDRHGPSYSER